MTSSWPTLVLGDVCDFERGLTYSKADEVATSSNVVLRANNIDLESGKLDLSDLRHINDEVVVRASKRVKENSLLICTASGSRSHLGKVAFVDRAVEAAFGGFMGQITPRAAISPRFLFHLLMSPSFKEHLLSLTGGTNINNLRLGEVAKFRFSLPPLAEQQRIVALLDEAFEGIAIARDVAAQCVANASQVAWQYLADVFEQPGADWVREPISKRVRFVDYRGKTPPKRAAGVRLITAKNVKMGFVQRSPEEFIDESAYAAWMTRGYPARGDVLFTTEAPLANVAQLDTDEPVVIGQRLITMQADRDRLSPTFLKYMLLSRPLQSAIRAKGTGATVQGIKARLLKQIEIMYPASLDRQLAIVARLDAIFENSEELARLHQRKLTALFELKQSLLARAFSGELTREPLAA